QGTEAMLTADRPNSYLAPSNGSHAPRPLINWNELNATLNLAEQHAPVGTTLPEMARFRGVRRKIARFVARIVLALSRVVTGPQRIFNATMVNGVRDVIESMRQLEQVHRAAFHRLDQRIDREVNKRLADMEKGLGQVKTSLPLQERRVTV